MANTATRLFNLVALLQRHPNRSASQLAEALDVSVRTVQRYIVMLEDMGIPVYAERGSQGGYSLVRGYRMPPLMLSPDEAVAIHLGTRVVEHLWGRLFRAPAQSALAKIENVLPREQLHEIAWAQGHLITRGIPRIDKSLEGQQIEQVYQAVRQSQQLNIRYQGLQQSHAIWRRIDPYVLVYSWGRQYCLAYCHLRKAVRSFRVDRIQDIEVLTARFTKPEDFDPNEHLEEAVLGEKSVEVRLYFGPGQATIAQDHRCCWNSYEERPDGSVVTGFQAPNLDTASQHALCFLTHARILAPEALKRRVASDARAIADQYEQQTDPLTL